MSSDQSSGNWLEHTFPWPNRLADWQERLIGLGLILIALTLVPAVRERSLVLARRFYSGACSPVYWVSHPGKAHTSYFGPVLFYDMVRTSRARSRYMITRLIYGGFLLFILCYLYLILWVSTNFNLNPNEMNEGMQRRAMAVLAESFFFFFMILQLAIVVLLTPAYVAGAIADEKDRKTMEFILATDLRDREIIFSKLLSRLANMAACVLVDGVADHELDAVSRRHRSRFDARGLCHTSP